VNLDTSARRQPGTRLHRALRHDRPQQQVDTQARIENQSRLVSWPKFLQQLAADCCLAGPHLARQLDETFALVNAEQQVVERLLMLRAKEQKARVRRDAERLFTQLVVR